MSAGVQLAGSLFLSGTEHHISGLLPNRTWHCLSAASQICTTVQPRNVLLQSLRLAEDKCSRRSCRSLSCSITHLGQQRPRSLRLAAVEGTSRQPSVDWSPVRSAYCGDSVFWYPFGNTPARNIFEGSPSATSLLLLGCGDLRNMLETCRASPNAEELVFTLNDRNPSIIARNALILAACAEMDLSSSHDLNFIWSVWYNLELSKPHYSKMQELATKLLQQPDRGWLTFSPGSWKMVAEVLESWLVDPSELPKPQTLRQERVSRIEKYFSLQMGSEEKVDYMDVAHYVLRPIVHHLGSEQCNIADAATHWKDGSVHIDKKSTRGNRFPNATLLHHKSRKWLVHYASSPFRSYVPGVSSGNVKRAGRLATACRQHLKAWIRSLLLRIKGQSIKILLSAEDALVYCWREERKFDVIDTSNLSDHIGLLNLLVSGSSRLTPKTTSKLFTSTLYWGTTSEPFSDFVSGSLRFDVTLTPAVLGLRLVSMNWKEAANFKEEREGIQGEKIVLWQPSPVPIPPLTVDLDDVTRALAAATSREEKNEMCAVIQSLCAVTSVCCYLPLCGSSKMRELGFHMSTVATLAVLVHNLCGSRIALLPDQSPQDLMLALCNGLCPSFSMEAEVVLRQMYPTRGGGLIQFTGKLLFPEPLENDTLTLRLLIAHKSVIAMGGRMWFSFLNLRTGLDEDFRHNKVMRSIHLVDSLAMDDDFTTSFLLPDDHRLNPYDWKVAVFSMADPIGWCLSEFKELSSFSSSRIELVDNFKLTPSRRPGTCTDTLRVLDLREYGYEFVAHIQYNGSPEGLFAKYHQQVESESSLPSLAVDIGFTEPKKQWVTLRFPSPVSLKGSTFRMWETERVVQCIFVKNISWPY